MCAEVGDNGARARGVCGGLAAHGRWLCPLPASLCCWGGPGAPWGRAPCTPTVRPCSCWTRPLWLGDPREEVLPWGPFLIFFFITALSLLRTRGGTRAPRGSTHSPGAELPMGRAGSEVLEAAGVEAPSVASVPHSPVAARGQLRGCPGAPPPLIGPYRLPPAWPR